MNLVSWLHVCEIIKRVFLSTLQNEEIFPPAYWGRWWVVAMLLLQHWALGASTTTILRRSTFSAKTHSVWCSKYRLIAYVISSPGVLILSATNTATSVIQRSNWIDKTWTDHSYTHLKILAALQQTTVCVLSLVKTYKYRDKSTSVTWRHSETFLTDVQCQWISCGKSNFTQFSGNLLRLYWKAFVDKIRRQTLFCFFLCTENFYRELWLEVMCLFENLVPLCLFLHTRCNGMQKKCAFPKWIRGIIKMPIYILIQSKIECLEKCNWFFFLLTPSADLLRKKYTFRIVTA